MKKEFKTDNPWNAMIDSFNIALTENNDKLPIAMKNTGESIAKATLKKVYDKSGNINIMHMRNSLKVDIGQVDNASNDGYKLMPLSDSYDLVNDGIQSLLESHAKGQDRTDSGQIDIEYRTIRNELSRHIWIDKELTGQIDNETLQSMYRDYESSPVQDAFRYTRQCIDKRGSIKIDPESKYSYIKEEIEDTAIYHRLPRYYQYLDVDITGSVSGHTTVTPTMPNTDTLTCLTGDYHFTRDDNGKIKIGAKTVSYTMDELWSDIVSELNLTEKQAKILKYRFHGLGYERIATLENVNKNAIQTTVKAIRDKAENVDLFNLYLLTHGYNTEDIENRNRVEQAESNLKIAVRKVKKLEKAVEQSEQKLNNGLIKADSHKRTVRRYKTALETLDKAEKQLDKINAVHCPNCKRVNGINWHTYRKYSHKIKTMAKPYMLGLHKPIQADRADKADKPIRFKLFERQLERQADRADKADKDRTKQADRTANYNNVLTPVNYDNYKLPKISHVKATEKSIYNWSYVLPFIPMDKAEKQTGQTDRTGQAEKASLKDCKWTAKEIAFWTDKAKSKKHTCLYEKEYWYINAKNMYNRMAYMDRKRQTDRQTAIANLTVKKWLSKHDCNTMTDTGFNRLCKYADRHNIAF